MSVIMSHSSLSVSHSATQPYSGPVLLLAGLRRPVLPRCLLVGRRHILDQDLGVILVLPRGLPLPLRTQKIIPCKR